MGVGSVCGGQNFFILDQAEYLNPLHLMSTPVSIASIIATSVLDSPSVPYLGSVTTFIGFPRPQRLWPRFNHLTNTGTRIEGLIYESLLPNLMAHLQLQIQRDIRNFQDQNYYLFLNETMGILLSVIQRGRNYAVMVARGAQIKSATLCHRDERSRISMTLEDVIALQRRCLFKTKGASLTPIKHFNAVTGLNIDTFNLSSRCIFDLQFNRALLTIFMYLLLDSIDELLDLWHQGLSPRQNPGAVFEEGISHKNYRTLYNIFPHQFAKQKISKYQWVRNNDPLKSINQQHISSPSVANSLRQISIHGFNTPSQSQRNMSLVPSKNLSLTGDEDQIEGNEVSYLASIEQIPGDTTSAFFTRVDRQKRGGAVSALGTHFFRGAIIPAESSLINSTFNNRHHSVEQKPLRPLQFPLTLPRQGRYIPPVVNPSGFHSDRTQNDTYVSADDNVEEGRKSKPHEFGSYLNPVGKRTKRCLSDSEFDVVNESICDTTPRDFADKSPSRRNLYSPQPASEMINRTHYMPRLQNLTKIEERRLNLTTSPQQARDLQAFMKQALPIKENFDQEMKQEDTIRPCNLQYQYSNPQLPGVKMNERLKEGNKTTRIQKQKAQASSTRFDNQESDDEYEKEAKIALQPKTIHVDDTTQFVLQLILALFPFLDGQPDSYCTAYESILNKTAFIEHKEFTLNERFLESKSMHDKLNILFIQALVAAYQRVILLDDEPIKSYEAVQDLLSDFKIVSPKQFEAGKFSDNSEENFDLNPSKTYCTVFSQDDIQIHQVRQGRNDFTLFGMKKQYLRSIWANMMFQILYVNNDNQERNSLQSNRYILQNLSAELAEHPLGYCAYSSGPMLLYF